MIQDERIIKMANHIHAFIKAMQEIKVICQRAESFGVEEDVEEILEIIKKQGI